MKRLLTCSFALLAACFLLLAFAHMGWNLLTNCPFTKHIEYQDTACIITADGEVFSEEFSLKGELLNYIVNSKHRDGFMSNVGDGIQIRDFTQEHIRWAQKDESGEFLLGVSENAQYLVESDLSWFIFQTELQQIDSTRSSVPCLVVCPAENYQAALVLLQYLDCQHLPGSWNSDLAPFIH